MLTEELGKHKSLVLVFQCCGFFAECVDTPQNPRVQADGTSWPAAELGAWGWALLATEAAGRPRSLSCIHVFSGKVNHVLLKIIIR